MLIQFHATLAASCNLRDIKEIGIAIFAYFYGTFSQRGIQFSPRDIPFVIYAVSVEMYEFTKLDTYLLK